MNLRRLLFYWITSALIAIPSYYLLWSIMPKNYVFGVYYRMLLYHYEYPVLYILIPCFFFGIIAMLFSNRFKEATFYKQLILTIIIIGLTILLSSPFGGMLWHYHDMRAGFFPDNWVWHMIRNGTVMGLQFGWLIALMSIPYNLLGSILSYYLLKFASQRIK